MNGRGRAVEALLRGYVAADAREEGHLRDMRALVGGAGEIDPFSRQAFAPGHFTASAFVTSPDARSILLVFHGKLHRWLQPGGHFDPEDESLFAAARREVAEETGVGEVDLVDGEVLFDVDVHEIPALKGDPPHRHFDLRVHLRARGWEHRAGSDARAARWTPLAEVSAEESDPSVLRAIRKLQKRLTGGSAP